MELVKLPWKGIINNLYIPHGHLPCCTYECNFFNAIVHIRIPYKYIISTWEYHDRRKKQTKIKRRAKEEQSNKNNNTITTKVWEEINVNRRNWSWLGWRKTCRKIMRSTDSVGKKERKMSYRQKPLACLDFNLKWQKEDDHPICFIRTTHWNPWITWKNPRHSNGKENYMSPHYSQTMFCFVLRQFIPECAFR